MENTVLNIAQNKGVNTIQANGKFDSKANMHVAKIIWDLHKNGTKMNEIKSWRDAVKFGAIVAKELYKVQVQAKDSSKNRTRVKVQMVGFKTNKAGDVVAKKEVIEKVETFIGTTYDSINQASIEFGKLLGRKVNSMSIKDAIKSGNRAAYGVVFKAV